jgi:urease accessory protein
MPKKSLLLSLPFIAGLIFSLLLAPAAQAHTGNHEIGGFLYGLEHPVGGLDHVLAMLAVGLWAAQLGGAGLWSLPGAFLTAMMVGGMLGMTGINMPFMEQGILISNLVLGAVVLAAIRLPLTISMGIVGALAVFHGYAHGAELPTGASGLEYAAGFICSTALLHLVGLGLALLVQKFSQDRFVQFAGAGILVSGLFLTARSFVG